MKTTVKMWAVFNRKGIVLLDTFWIPSSITPKTALLLTGGTRGGNL